MPQFQRLLMLNHSFALELLLRGAIDNPAHHPTHKDRESRADGQIGSHCQGQRADPKQLNHDDQRHAEQHERPRKLAAEDAVDDRGHQSALRRCGLLAADALCPLDFDLAGGRVVEILAVGKGGGADSVQQEVLTCVGELAMRG